MAAPVQGPGARCLAPSARLGARLWISLCVPDPAAGFRRAPAGADPPHRPVEVVGQGFVAWGLRFLYSADPPYNCFPSLHVAHSFVSALACSRVHRGVGIGGVVCASLVGLSTLFTKQHYVLDVLALGLLGALGLAVVCFWVVYQGAG